MLNLSNFWSRLRFSFKLTNHHKRPFTRPTRWVSVKEATYTVICKAWETDIKNSKGQESLAVIIKETGLLKRCLKIHSTSSSLSYKHKERHSNSLQAWDDLYQTKLACLESHQTLKSTPPRDSIIENRLNLLLCLVNSNLVWWKMISLTYRKKRRIQSISSTHCTVKFVLVNQINSKKKKKKKKRPLRFNLNRRNWPRAIIEEVLIKW